MIQNQGPSVAYTPNTPPDDPKALKVFLQNELRQIATAIAVARKGRLDKTTVAPPRPRDGDLVYADGTSWNPGSGQGAYIYYGAAWHFLG